MPGYYKDTEQVLGKTFGMLGAWKKVGVQRVHLGLYVPARESST